LKVRYEIGQKNGVEGGMMELDRKRHEEILLDLMAMAEVEHGSCGLKSRLVKREAGELEGRKVADE
jgi:hypothetical protein